MKKYGLDQVSLISSKDKKCYDEKGKSLSIGYIGQAFRPQY